jgi:hypothetical protein
MNDKIHSHGIGPFHIVALVVISVITFAGIAPVARAGARQT